MRPGLLLPFCVVISAVIHVVLLTAVAVPRQRVTHGQTMTVDLVTPDEVPDSVNKEPPSEAAPAPAPQGSTEALQQPQPAATPPAPSQQMASNEPPSRRETRQAWQRPAPQRPPQAEQQQQPAQQQPPQQEPQQAAKPATETPPPGTQLPPDTLADQAERLSAMLNLPGPGFGDGTGAEAVSKAKLTKDEVEAFRAHLRSCWKLPRGVTGNERLKMVIRLSLRTNGTLASDPTLIEGGAIKTEADQIKLIAVRDEAMRTIRQCAPYAMLPPEKYREWRVLDVDFSPDQMSNG